MFKAVILFKMIFFSFVRCYRQCPSRILPSFRCFASRKSKDSDPVPNTAPGWVTIKLGNGADEKAREMEDRINKAQKWVSKKLSDEESEILNRSLGIEKEVLDALNENDLKSPKKGVDNRLKSLLTKRTQSNPTPTEEMKSAAKVRGFLELNPYLCSGCGTPFQSKSPDAPGYLQKDKLQDHRVRAALIRDKQEAIKILDMAGIEITSPVAEKILRDAKISPDVIAGVRALAYEDSDSTIRSPRNLNTEPPSVRKQSLAPISTYSDENDYEEEDEDMEEEDDDDDPLHGLEIDLDDLVKGMGSNADEPGPGDGNDIGSALVRSISKAAESVTREKKSEAVNVLQEFAGENIASAIERELLREKRFSAPKMRTDKSTLTDASDIIPSLLGQPGMYAASPQSAAPAAVSTALPDGVCVCQRCFRLQQYGQVEEGLRPGWSSHELLTPDRFEHLLNVIKDTDAVVLCIVDLFDLHGSLLPNLKTIAGNNPIIVAANKIDLLPKDVSQPRILAWVHETVKKFCGLRSPRDAEYEQKRLMKERGWVRSAEKESGVLGRQNVHLVSCQSGIGMQSLMSSINGLASQNGNKVYVMGAANVGKSSFINRLLDTDKAGSKGRRSNTPLATVSNLPGTTLDFLKIKLPNGITVIDTPGLINKGVLTTRVNFAELKQIIPVKPINAVTLRVMEGKCVLIGGFARIELTEGRPVFFTFYVSNEVKLHPTDSLRADEFVAKHVGSLVAPPASFERVQELGPYETHTFTIEGDSWKKAAKDIVVAGLGWIAVTGPGTCRVTVRLPQGTSVDLRESLMPYDAMHTTAKFTGGRLSKKSSRPGAKSYGWRA